MYPVPNNQYEFDYQTWLKNFKEEWPYGGWVMIMAIAYRDNNFWFRYSFPISHNIFKAHQGLIRIYEKQDKLWFDIAAFVANASILLNDTSPENRRYLSFEVRRGMNNDWVWDDQIIIYPNIDFGHDFLSKEYRQRFGVE